MSVSYMGSSHAAKRVSWFLLFLIGVALTVTLYFVKTQSQSAKRDVRILTQALAAEAESIRVLRAELAFLESPARLSDLNETHLHLEPILPDQEVSIKAVETLFPLTDGEFE